MTLVFWVSSIFLVIALLGLELYFLNKLKIKYDTLQKNLKSKFDSLTRQEYNFNVQITATENVLTERFLFYDITRKIAPLFDRKHLITGFVQEIKHLGEISDVTIEDMSDNSEYKKFKFGRSLKDSIYVKTKSQAVIDYLPYFIKLLGLCSERIKLYGRLQELTIYDSLTKIYNRRYFLMRYLEEFKRANRLGLEVSFLMIDIDYFKKINDTYGHLVGDAVLRAVAKILKKSMREMDFVARYGGEEFSVILPETDKAGAIMVAERISSRISRERIKVFDETLSVSLSIGVASFPHNTLHSDVLIEIADKALYKAKLSGRNRVCWF